MAQKEAVSKPDFDDYILRKVESAGALADRILELAGDTDGRMLMVDCAGGYLAAAIAKRSGWDLTVVDSSPKGLTAAEKTMSVLGLEGRATYVGCSAMSLEFDDESFDCVVSIEALGTWRNPQTGIEECYRCLKNDGMAFITWGDRNTYRDYFGMLKALGYPKFSLNNDADTTWIEITKLEVEQIGRGMFPSMM